MGHGKRRTATGAAVGLAYLLLAGCGSAGIESAGGGPTSALVAEDDDAAMAQVGTAPTTTTAPSTTTSLVISTTSAGKLDEQAIRALAATGAGRPEDLGAGWTAVTGDQAMEDPRQDQCALLVPGPLAQLRGVAAHSGPVVRHDATGFTTVTVAYAFEDAVQAGLWLAVSRDAAYIECDRARVESLQQAAFPGVSVGLSERNASLSTSGDFSVARDVLTTMGDHIGLNDRRHHLVRNVVIVQIGALVGPLDQKTAGAIAVQLHDALERAATRIRDGS